MGTEHSVRLYVIITLWESSVGAEGKRGEVSGRGRGGGGRVFWGVMSNPTPASFLSQYMLAIATSPKKLIRPRRRWMLDHSYFFSQCTSSMGDCNP